MNYSALSAGLMNEVLSAKQYEKLDSPYGILAFLGLLPVHLLSAFTFIFYHILSFVFNMFSSGVSYIEVWMNETKKGVNHATEAVIYFVCLPVLLLSHFLLSMLSIGFFLVWFQLQCLLYISTLGGIRWQPYINHAHFNVSIHEYKITTSSTWGARVATITLISLVVLLISALTVLAGESSDNSGFIGFMMWVYLAMTTIIIPVTFRKTHVVATNSNDQPTA